MNDRDCCLCGAPLTDDEQKCGSGVCADCEWERHEDDPGLLADRAYDDWRDRETFRTRLDEDR